ncbi:MAG: glycosyltransferase family 4 protein [Candidatus Binatia bacterium]
MATKINGSTMRVLYWSELFWPYIGGVEVLSAKLLPELRDRGCEIIVVTSHDFLDLPDRAEYKGISIYRFPFRSAISTGNIGQLFELRGEVSKLKQTFQPDLVHVNAVSPSVLFHLQTIDACSVPTLVTMQQEILPKEGAGCATLMGEALRSADWVSCVSSAVLAQVLGWVPELRSRSSVIYNALEMELDSPKPLPEKPPRLLCVGRLVPAKGFDIALQAMALIAARFPEIRLTVAGGGPLQTELERKADELGLSNRVEFLGWVEPDKVASVINESSIVLMPSRREGLPIVAVQAAMMGRPVIGTRVSGIPEVVLDGETGMLIDPEDAAGLMRALSFLLAHPKVAVRMGDTARIRAQELFNWDRCVADYYLLYQKLIKEVTYAEFGHSRARV